MTTPTRLDIAMPDDWHVHLRQGEMLENVLPYTAAHFGRAIVMPNLQPPVVRTADALAYRDSILATLPTNSSFQPLMTLYMTETTEAADVKAGFEAGVVTAVKLYPAGATTNSAAGVKDLEKAYLDRIEEVIRHNKEAIKEKNKKNK